MLTTLAVLAASIVPSQCGYGYPPPPVYFDPCPPTYYYPRYSPAYCPTYTTPAYTQPAKRAEDYWVPYYEKTTAPAKKATTATPPRLSRGDDDSDSYRRPAKRIENLEFIPAKTVTPKVVYEGEIRTTVYIDATLPGGKSIRVPIVNGLMPEVRLSYANGKLDNQEYHYDRATAFAGKAGDSLTYKKSPRQPPSIEESVEKDDGYGGRVKEVRYRYENFAYVPDQLVAKKVEPPAPPPPDSKLKRPSDIDK
jgi:hypothetical protein